MCSFAGVEWKKTQIGHMSLCLPDWQNHSSSPIHTLTMFVNGDKEDKSEEWEERLWKNKIKLLRMELFYKKAECYKCIWGQEGELNKRTVMPDAPRMVKSVGRSMLV